jgi:hypothetical protein
MSASACWWRWWCGGRRGVDVLVDVRVGVLVGGGGVAVGCGVDVFVGVRVGVLVAGGGVAVGCGVEVFVDVRVGVLVDGGGVAVGCGVEVFVVCVLYGRRRRGGRSGGVVLGRPRGCTG